MNEQFVYDKIEYYRNRMCLNKPRLIMLTKKETIDFDKDDVDYHVKVNKGKIWGTNFGSYDGSPVFINLEDIKNKKQIENTIIHELLHSKVKYSHTLKFYYAISEIKKGYFPPREFTRFKRLIWKIKRCIYEEDNPHD